MERELVYLACPYSHPDRDVRIARFEAANKCAGRLMKEGYKVFSPISHTHPIAETCELPLGWDYWEQYDRAFIKHCNAMFILTLDGWRESKGVTGEIRIAEEYGVPYHFIQPE